MPACRCAGSTDFFLDQYFYRGRRGHRRLPRTSIENAAHPTSGIQTIMSKRNPMDKAQARERRNQLLESAAAANLSLTEGVREMRAISGMTQEEFAQHRDVSPRVIKALELGQGNPTVATLNRIGAFFGVEVGFVRVRRAAAVTEPLPQHKGDEPKIPGELDLSTLQNMLTVHESLIADLRKYMKGLENPKVASQRKRKPQSS